MASSVRGGKKLQQFINRGKRAGEKTQRVDVGFFSTARYPDGTGVAAVAAWNEFGTKFAPERPFFRQAIENMDESLPPLIREYLDPKNPIMTPRVAAIVGEKAKAEIQSRITLLSEPENSPATVKAKGSDNPLIDKGFMRNSVAYRTE